jgi:hypothetical protein
VPSKEINVTQPIAAAAPDVRVAPQVRHGALLLVMGARLDGR